MLISLIAISPIVVLVALVLFSRLSFLVSAVLSLAALIIAAFFVWEVSLIILFASATKGLFVALEIIAIIFGALLIFEIFKHLGGEKAARQFFDKISSDYHIRVTLIAWALVVFLEGISGFGTPAIIAVPLLMSVGVPPIPSAIISLIGGSLPVTFGAVGLPVTYGLAAVIGEYLAIEAASLITILNLIMAPIVVATILYVVSKEKNKLQDIKHNLFFIIFAASAVSIPSLIAFQLFGPAITSIIGGLSGIIFISLYAIWRKRRQVNTITILPAKNLISFAPYVAVAVLLIIIKIPFLESFLRGIFSINVFSIFGTAISYVFHPLASPAIVFMIVAIIFSVGFWGRKKGHHIQEIITSSTRRIMGPSFAIISILIFAQIMLNSGINNAGLPNMAESAANIFYGANQVSTILAAPAIGALGAFITGSSTVSNLLFAPIQQSLAVSSGVEDKIIIALQGMGSAAGNVIGINNILIALTVAGVGLKEGGRELKQNKKQTNQDIIEAEKSVIKANMPFLLMYVLLIGMLGVVLALSGLI